MVAALLRATTGRLLSGHYLYRAGCGRHAFAAGEPMSVARRVEDELHALDPDLAFITTDREPPRWVGRSMRVLETTTLKQAMEACREACDPKFGDYAIYEHCLPFNVARAYDEARDIDTPRIWTAERDREMWEALQG